MEKAQEAGTILATHTKHEASEESNRIGIVTVQVYRISAHENSRSIESIQQRTMYIYIYIIMMWSSRREIL